MLVKLMRQAFAFIGLGLLIIALALLSATLVWYLTGFDWLFSAVLLLVFGAIALVGIAAGGGGRPVVSDASELYTEMMGRTAGGGSLRDMTRPHLATDLHVLTNAALPFVAGLALLFSGLL
jgi:hypothetical protein